MTGSTVIPSLGITFTEAEAKAHEQIGAWLGFNAAVNDEEGQAYEDALRVEMEGTIAAILAAEPQTPQDALIVLDRLLCPKVGIPSYKSHGEYDEELAAVSRVRDFLATQALAFLTGTHSEEARQGHNGTPFIAPATGTEGISNVDTLVTAGHSVKGVRDGHTLPPVSDEATSPQPSKGVGNSDTPGTADGATVAEGGTVTVLPSTITVRPEREGTAQTASPPPQAPFPPKKLTPANSLRGSVTDAASLFPIPWQDKSAAPLNSTVDCAVTGPFYLDVIDYNKPGPVSGRRFGWFVSGLLMSGFLADGEEDSREAAKAAAEEALRELVANDPELLVMDEPDLGDHPSHAAVLASVRADYGNACDILEENHNEERLEADLTVVAERLRKALAAAGPLASIDDAMALEGFQHELWEWADSDGYGLSGARGVMLKAVADHLARFVRLG